LEHDAHKINDAVAAEFSHDVPAVKLNNRCADTKDIALFPCWKLL
jgi:hypothetical protein